MYRTTSLAALAAFTLAGCTHLGTNISGQFSCRAQSGHPQAAGCQALSEADAKAVRELIKTEGGDLGTDLTQVRQRLTVAAADPNRTGERTLRVVFPAHVDAAGTLHEEAAIWTVIEAARWAGELHGADVIEPKGTMRALRQALKDQAQRAADAARKPEPAQSLDPLAPSPNVSGEDIAPASLFAPSSPSVLPSPDGGADAGARAPSVPGPAAEGSVSMSPTEHDRTPRPLSQGRIWPSAAAIEAAKALKAKALELKDHK